MTWTLRASVRACLALLLLVVSLVTAAQVYDGGTVRTIAVQSDGKIIIGGSFTHVGSTARSNIARLNVDGSLDATWNPGSNGEVRVLLLDGAGNVYAGGDFTSIGGQVRPYVARVSTSASAADAWSPSGNGPVNSLVLDGSGSIIVGGAFTNIGGQPRNNIAKIPSSGSGAADSTWNPDANGVVNSLARDAGGVYVGGQFTNIGGASRNRIAKLVNSGSGTADPAWNPNAGNEVKVVSLDGFGNLYAGGLFRTISGLTRECIAKLSTAGTGTADGTWAPGASEDGPFCGPTLAIKFDASGNVYVGGGFSTMGGTGGWLLARLSPNGTGARDTSWDTIGGPPGSVHAIDIAANGKVLVGGDFSQLGLQGKRGISALDPVTASADVTWPMALNPGGTVRAIVRDGSGRTIIAGLFSALGPNATPRSNIGRFDSGGGLDLAWNPGASYEVHALAVDSASNVYLGGSFNAVGGLARSNIAKVSGTGSGAVDPSWNPGAASTVHALAVEGSTLFVGGLFSTIGGADRRAIAKLSTADGTVDPTWIPGTGFPTVRALVLDGSGFLYAGGSFTTIGGQSRNRIAKLSTGGAGSADPTWNPDANSQVYALALDGAGQLYAGGTFNFIGGQSRRVAKLSTSGTGSADASWDPSFTGAVYALAANASTVYLGGTFSTVGGQARLRVAKVAAGGSGTVDAIWNPGAGGPGFPEVYALTLGAGANVHVGGRFQVFGGQLVGGYAIAGIPTVPGAPTLWLATSGNAQATLSILSGSNGGSAITGYSATCNPGSIGSAAATSPLTVMGLTNGVTYTCTVRATNSVGTSADSAAVSVTPTAPGAPIITSVNATTFTVGVQGSFTVIATGSPAPTFSQTGALPTGVTFTPGTATLAGTAPGASVGTYGITFTATNSQGTANQSFTLTVAPNVPGKPVISSIVAGSNQATINFPPPPSNGSPIVSYKARCSDGATTVEQTASAPPIVVTGLTNGVPYTCTVDATNGVGDGPQSDPSGVTPGGGGGGSPPTTNVGSLAFGGQSMGTTSPAQVITITNPATASAAINITGISLSPQFGQSNNCTTLAVGASCNAQVSFTPAVVAGALNATVPVTGTLTITTSANHNLAVSLSGTAEKSLVTHYYRSILRRAPDSGGQTFWSNEAARVAALGANVNETWFALAATFYRSGEYVAQNRNTTEYVRDLYNTFFNRAADDGGLSNWTGKIDAGLPREVVLLEFMFSAEFANFTQAIFGNTGARAEVNTVIDFYRGLLGRLPDNGGFNFWVGRFRTAQCQGGGAVIAEVEAISSAFALGSEYASRGRDNTQYVGDLYNAFLRRGGDLGGFNFWVNQIAGGFRTREQVRVDFKASPEFQGRVNAIVSQGCL